MTPREKILRDGLERIAQLSEKIIDAYLADHPGTVARIARRALASADAVVEAVDPLVNVIWHGEMRQLLPCPFCGNAKQDGWLTIEGSDVYCHNCGCSKGGKDPIDAWNQRAILRTQTPDTPTSGRVISEDLFDDLTTMCRMGNLEFHSRVLDELYSLRHATTIKGDK